MPGNNGAGGKFRKAARSLAGCWRDIRPCRLIGLLADAGRRRLTTFVLGSEQERALRSAARVAIRLTAEKLPSGDEAQVELVINQVLSEPMPSAPPAKALDRAGRTAGRNRRTAGCA